MSENSSDDFVQIYKGKTLDDWIKIYEKKTKTKFEQDARAKLFFDGEKGFAEIGITKNLVVI